MPHSEFSLVEHSYGSASDEGDDDPSEADDENEQSETELAVLEERAARKEIQPVVNVFDRFKRHRSDDSNDDGPRMPPERTSPLAWRKKEAARLAAWETARLAAWEGLSMTQHSAGGSEHLEEELSMTQQLAGGSGSIPPACNQHAASCPSLSEKELNMTQQLAAEHATSKTKHAACLAEHATRSAKHATRLAEHATSPAKHATCPAEHAIRPAEHATSQPGYATGSAKHATCPAEQATRLAQHATRSAEHATGGSQQLESGSDSDSTHVSATDSGITHASATDSDTTHVSATDSDTSHVSATDSDTTHVSDTNSDTTHVSPTDRIVILLTSVPRPTSPWTLLAHTLSAVRDEEGPLLLVFYAYLRGHRVKVLVDSGASDNFISAECARTCDLTVRSGTPMKVTLADGSVKTAGEVAYTKFTAHTAAGVNYCEKRMALRVLPLGIQVDVVLGGKWLRSLSPVTLDYAGHGSVSFNTRANGGGQQRVTLAGCSPGMGQGKAQGAGLIDEVFLTSTQLKQHLIHAETRRLAGDEESQPQWLMMAARCNDHEAAFAATAAEVPPPHTPVEKEEPRQDTRDAPVSSTWKQRFDAFFEKYLDTLCAALPEASKLRRTEEDKARIDRKPDAEGGPPCRRPYKMTAEELRQLRERIEQLMKKGYIRPSSSPYAAPCLMVPKPGDPKTLRLVVDYRQLNQQTVRDRYPLPDIQLMFDKMQGAAFFSSFDAVDGFWHVPMAEEDVEKTAFTTQMGAYEWSVMPQGLQNSPSQYQRRMQRALGHLPFVRIFIDDVVVFSRTVEEHYDHVRQFLDTCREKGVYLKASKAQMLKESLRITTPAKGSSARCTIALPSPGGGTTCSPPTSGYKVTIAPWNG
ncbi:hypothetical protein CYMTET_4727 [Cymbomonas tetramitiformis]|uniref:Reverse transcriptase domain-containing protein n=1 Tax=Cymbomonas tetramitiformis TaxID=36881 RepID=A0AAE0H0T7_9CHLO|nr:hypothetical protein CYMTET_4727 [Cymbomonas tetramitiformis]